MSIQVFARYVRRLPKRIRSPEPPVELFVHSGLLSTTLPFATPLIFTKSMGPSTAVVECPTGMVSDEEPCRGSRPAVDGDGLLRLEFAGFRNPTTIPRRIADEDIDAEGRAGAGSDCPADVVFHDDPPGGQGCSGPGRAGFAGVEVETLVIRGEDYDNTMMDG